jgi:AraC-like DNA-binding protein
MTMRLAPVAAPAGAGCRLDLHDGAGALAVDRLEAVLRRVSMSAGVFHSGQVCGFRDFERDTQRGALHIVSRGPVELRGGSDGVIVIDRPTLVFMPRPGRHRLSAGAGDGADVVCASIRFGAGGSHPVTDALPELICIPLDEFDGTRTLLTLMQEEAFAQHCGRQAALDRLCEVLMIHVLRYCLDHGLARGGTLAALADARLARTMAALHDNPAHPWDLEAMARLAGMSRARFAAHFREVTGATPADYLASWRMALAQGLLRAGRPLKNVAFEVGYASASALTRVFTRKVGTAPSQWLRHSLTDPPPTPN